MTVDDMLPILGPPLCSVDQAVRCIDAHRPTAANGYTEADIRIILQAYETTAELAGISHSDHLLPTLVAGTRARENQQALLDNAP